MLLFLFRMARNNGTTVKQLLRDLGNDDELLYWIAFDAIDPAPDSWLQTGVVCSTLANCHRSKGRSFKPADFMPKADQKAQTQDEMLEVFKSLPGVNVIIKEKLN